MNDKMKAKCYRLDYNELGLSTLCVEKDKEIERLTAESTKWESKFYDEAKKVDRAIEYIEEAPQSLCLPNGVYDMRRIDKTELLDILKGDDKE